MKNEDLYNRRGDLVIRRNDQTERYEVLDGERVVFSDVRYDVSVARYRPRRVGQQRLNIVPTGMGGAMCTLEDVLRGLRGIADDLHGVESDLVTREELEALQAEGRKALDVAREAGGRR